MKKQTMGTLFCFLAALCFSINGLLIKLLTWSAMSINSAGNLIGVLTILLYVVLTKHKLVFNRYVFIGGMFVFLTNLVSTYANKLTTAANAIVLQFTMPIFIILAMWIFFRQRPKKLDVITSLIVLIGIFFFVVDGISVGNWLGNILALITGIVCAGVYMLEEIPGNDSFSAIIFGKALCFIVGIPSVMNETPLTGLALGGMIIYGVIQCGLSFIFLPIGLKYASPVSASLLSSAEPLLAPVWVALFYPSEQVTGIAWVGFAIVMVTLIIYNLLKAKQSETDATCQTAQAG